MQFVEKDAAAVELYYLAAAAVVTHEQDKLNQERKGKQKKNPENLLGASMD